MRSRVRSTRKKPEVFKWKKCMEDFVHGQLGAGYRCGHIDQLSWHSEDLHRAVW